VSFIELVRLALSRLRTGRLRAALTMLGVVIGVASVVALVGVGQGTSSNITARLSQLGTNLLTISPAGANGGASSTLTEGDADAIRALTGVTAVAPETATQALVIAGRQNTTTSIVGTTADYAAVRAYDVWQGSFLTDPAVAQDLRVAVLGSTTASDLGLDQTALGTEISIGGIPFRLIGILQPKGSAGFQDADDEVLVPIGAIQKYFVSGDGVRTIGVSVADEAEMSTVQAEITNVLDARHNLSATDTADFNIFDQAQLLQTVSSVSDTLTLLLGGIASISLVVGGIGIMNIMLVSVRERTREIGVRMAIGARRRDILAQFLIEALTLSGLGGILGILLGLAVSGLISRLGNITFAYSPQTLAVAFLFSLGVGIVFGVWPARQAARLDPINALRYE
jgi:putative ABC transport system permease protein